MLTISSLLKKYQGRIDFLDLELIIAHVIKKNREFVLSHPEKSATRKQESMINEMVMKRIKHEPLAYILGEKEFYGNKFKVNKNTLIPRPETEMIVDLVLEKIKNKKNNTKIIDVGTGSGNIIISISKQTTDYELFGTDTSKKALTVAKQNAKINKVEKKIKFLHGNLLEPIIKSKIYNLKATSLIITANLPYLSPEIYKSCSKDIKKYEPKSALISQKEGLWYYEELLKQIVAYHLSSVTCFLEISPEQKTKISKLIKKYFPSSKITFHKDISGRWRVCEIEF